MHSDTAQAEEWIKEQEAVFNPDVGDSLDTVEAQIKKHEEELKSLNEQEEKTKALEEFAERLVTNSLVANSLVANSLR